MGDGVGDLAFWIAIGIGQVAFWNAMTPLIKAFAHRIEGRRHDDERLSAIESRLHAIEDRALTSGEVDNQFLRLNELEERMDFAERVLTQGEARQSASGSDNS